MFAGQQCCDFRNARVLTDADWCGKAGDVCAHLRPANTHIHKMTSHAAGPFEPTSGEVAGPTMRDALVTGLLVIYPALAIVAAIFAGLYMSRTIGA
ncbi:hypothetical protein [Mesorhizobium sp. B4-1-4]|uniref:hypothetical protein n=1 Tax=Mesorhizobium sp. B4-1-4 TaxID=2589888 RepID=UPI00112C2AA1|nr:hypothetical protein [Mesorhizobium sp. B4-1-4]TPK92473.1 hypothetical protein FJ548_00875 [Mesorhizobium sp. B2-4-17]UCI34953.1 hypothetical protein FJW03_15175 [Mesorhizobium sp. B4-1-4]